MRTIVVLIIGIVVGAGLATATAVTIVDVASQQPGEVQPVSEELVVYGS